MGARLTNRERGEFIHISVHDLSVLTLCTGLQKIILLKNEHLNMI